MRETQHESIRLDPSLWEAARIEQESRMTTGEDPITHALADKLAGHESRITSEDVWKLLGYPEAKGRTSDMLKWLGQAMKALGWTPKTVKLESGRQAKRVQGYGKGKTTKRVGVTTTTYNGRTECKVAPPNVDPDHVEPESEF